MPVLEGDLIRNFYGAFGASLRSPGPSCKVGIQEQRRQTRDQKEATLPVGRTGTVQSQSKDQTMEDVPSNAVCTSTAQNME